MAPTDLRTALRSGHRAFLGSSWPWRAFGYLGGGLVMALPTLAVHRWLLEVETLSGFLVLTLAVLVGNLLIAVPLAGLERRRLRVVDKNQQKTVRVHLPVKGIGRWLLVRLGEAATWREFAYALLLTLVLSFVDIVLVTLVLSMLFMPFTPLVEFILDYRPIVNVGVPVTGTLGMTLLVIISLALMPLFAYGVGYLALAQSALARYLLTPRDTDLNTQIHELTRSRTRLVDAFQAERERIERDLHDGAQQRLTALVLTLGVAELETSRGGGDGRRLITRAKGEAQQVLAELRELIRGIRPQVLTDRGIAAAVGDIADRCPLPVDVRIDLPHRLPPAIETVAYFAVSEALTNVIKHSGAHSACVTGALEGDRLRLMVTDDGVGGADPADGTGLQGLADRLSVVEGRLRITSPSGGPTQVFVEVPCQSLAVSG
ncbi:hypothetical protein ALI144C_35515 [Actinosynnema sp. ALI-1.44]|nr:hypothetical protein ALI144C_35515 [Actinosynnema sp. ALI-1.44]